MKYEIQVSSRKIPLITNMITATRLILTPPIAYSIYNEIWDAAFFLGAIAIASDFLDGMIARKFNMVSDFGRKFDPTVDKIVLITIFLIFFIKDLTPPWFTLTVLGKDILIPIILLAGKIMGAKLDFSPTKVGKAAVAIQFLIAILVVVEKFLNVKTYFELLMYPGVVACALSLISYIKIIASQVSEIKK